MTAIKPSNFFSLDVGDRVELLTIDRMYDRTGKVGTICGFGRMDRYDGRECYWVQWDGSKKTYRQKYHINYLLVIGTT